MEGNSLGLRWRTAASVPGLAEVDGARVRPADGGVKHRRQDLLEREGVDVLLVERRAAVLRNLLRAGNRVALVECAADLLRRSAFDEVPRLAHASGIALPRQAREFPATALGMLLVLSAACLIGLLPETLPTMDLTHSAVELTLHTTVPWAFGRTIVNVVHSFWCEVQFDSVIVFFQCSGTYSESKISIGMAIHDTASSENYMVRSRLTPMLIVVKAVTSTFVGRGSRSFDNSRYLLEFDRAPGELESILGEFREFL